MTKSAEVRTRLTAHRDCPQPTRPKSYYPKANHQRFCLRTKPAPVAAVEQLRKSGDFFFINLVNLHHMLSMSLGSREALFVSKPKD